MLSSTFAGPQDLIQPDALIVDRSLAKAMLDAEVLAGRRYDTFWNTGEEALALAALAPSFVDNTLPAGRPQGVDGALKASKPFRMAVPDLRCQVRQMIVAGDRVITHLHFTGHFFGMLGGKKGRGEVIDFIATDSYRIADGRIVQDWLLEDHLTFLQQVGLVAKKDKKDTTRSRHQRKLRFFVAGWQVARRACFQHEHRAGFGGRQRLVRTGPSPTA